MRVIKELKSCITIGDVASLINEGKIHYATNEEIAATSACKATLYAIRNNKIKENQEYYIKLYIDYFLTFLFCAKANFNFSEAYDMALHFIRKKYD